MGSGSKKQKLERQTPGEFCLDKADSMHCMLGKGCLAAWILRSAVL